MNTAIIPARGGSKRIPRKNIRSFRGLPMIAHAIQCAKSTGLFERIVVSTDDSEIAEIAVQYGAEVPFLRQPELADDHAGTLPVIQDAIRRIGVTHGCVAAIYPTVPLLQKCDLISAYESWNQNEQKGIVIPVCRYAYPVYRSFIKEGQAGLRMLFPECYSMRSQDLPPVFHDAALFYLATPEIWLESDRIYRPDSIMMEIPGDHVCDIDTPDDWARAEFLANWQERQNSDSNP
jgi:pseudaminic acid cytidylyltransferase